MSLGNTISEDIPKNEIVEDIKKEENKSNGMFNRRSNPNIWSI